MNATKKNHANSGFNTQGNSLDDSRDSWSSLELDGLLSPTPLHPPPPPSPSLPSFSTPSPLPAPLPQRSVPTLPSTPTLPHPPASSPRNHPPRIDGLTRKVLKRKIQRGVKERVSNFWREKIGHYVMQGDFLALIQNEGSCLSWKSFMWDVPQGVLKFAINAGINTLPSCDNLKRWGKRASDRCSFCGNIETLAHILSNCSTALTQGRFTWRHNSVLSSIINVVQPHLREGLILFSDLPGRQAPHGGTIPPNIHVTALRPDIFICSQVSQEVIILELTCPWDSNIERSHRFKSEKYAPLVADLSSNYVVSFYSIEVSARGQITKENRSRLKSFFFKCCMGTNSVAKALINLSSKAALLTSYSIFSARREPSWEDPPPLILK